MTVNGVVRRCRRNDRPLLMLASAAPAVVVDGAFRLVCLLRIAALVRSREVSSVEYPWKLN
jgi:hypothetical protein